MRGLSIPHIATIAYKKALMEPLVMLEPQNPLIGQFCVVLYRLQSRIVRSGRSYFYVKRIFRHDIWQLPLRISRNYQMHVLEYIARPTLPQFLCLKIRRTTFLNIIKIS